MNVPPPSELSDHPNLQDEGRQATAVLHAVPPPPVAPLSDFELELRQRLTQLEAHQARTDAVVLSFQGDVRRQFRDVESRLGAKLDGVASLIGRLVTEVSKLVGNGHG